MPLNTTMLAGPTPETDPNFPVITVAIKRDVNEEIPVLATLLDRVDQLVAEGKSDGIAYIYWNPASTECITFRNWSTVEVANDWISFATSLGNTTFESITLYS